MIYNILPTNSSNKIRADLLHREVKESLWVEIEWITIKTDKERNVLDVAIEIQAGLTQQQIDSLQAIVDQHNYDNIANVEYRIYSYMYETWYNKTVVPYDKPYDILWLHEDPMYENGELMSVNYWGTYSEESWFNDLVVKEENNLIRDDNGYIVQIETSIIWYTNSGVASQPKVITRRYTPMMATIAWEKRRSYVINEIKVSVVWLIAATELKTVPEAEVMWMVFMNKYTLEVQKYRDWDRFTLVGCFTNHNITDNPEDAWLDNQTNVPNWEGWTLSIREYMIYLLQR